MTLRINTTFGQTAALIAVVTLCYLAIAVFAFRFHAARAGASALVSELASTADAAAELTRRHPDADPVLMRQALQAAGHSVLVARAAPRRARIAGSLRGTPIRGLASQLRSALPAGTAFRLYAKPTPTVWFSGPETAGLWIGQPLNRLRAQRLNRWPIVLAAFGCLVLIAAFWFARHLGRPLRRLVKAADDIARGRIPAVDTDSGPHEIRRLAQALQRMANEVHKAGEERELLLAGVSHDLRTPLARLRFAMEMLEQSDPTLVDGMVRDVDEMDAIIEQFLAYLHAARDEPTQVCDLNALVTEATAGFREGGAPLSLEPGDVPAAAMRPLAVRRLVANLAGNALKHGQPPVTVRTGCANGAIFVAVRDHGGGFDAAELTRLSKPFHRGGGSSRGLGLGLAIVARIVHVHGGGLKVDRADGEFEIRASWPLSVPAS